MVGRIGAVRGRARIPDSMRRKVEWLASADTIAITQIGPSVQLLVQSYSEAQLDAGGENPSTVVRVRGDLWIRSDQVVAVEEPFGALAMAVVTEQARAIGATAVPMPIADEPSSAFFMMQYWQAGAYATTAGVDSPWSRYSFDSKAQRKITNGDAIVVVMENAHTTHQASFILKFRILLKLH